MLYQLPNGKVIEISTEQYLEMTDEELEYLIAYNYGETLEDPWFGSVLNKHSVSDLDNSEVELLDDLLDISENETPSDLDVDYIPDDE